MKIYEITEILRAKKINNTIDNNDYYKVFSSDLMSDVLAMINIDFDNTILLTGLCNAQSLRTAEMLDLKTIIYVRGKKLDSESIALADKMNISVYSTEYTMYEASGKLYMKGMKSIDFKRNL